jgi:hypothetical protein
MRGDVKMTNIRDLTPAQISGVTALVRGAKDDNIGRVPPGTMASLARIELAQKTAEGFKATKAARALVQEWGYLPPGVEGSRSVPLEKLGGAVTNPEPAGAPPASKKDKAPTTKAPAAPRAPGGSSAAPRKTKWAPERTFKMKEPNPYKKGVLHDLFELALKTGNVGDYVAQGGDKTGLSVFEGKGLLVLD